MTNCQMEALQLSQVSGLLRIESDKISTLKTLQQPGEKVSLFHVWIYLINVKLSKNILNILSDIQNLEIENLKK